MRSPHWISSIRWCASLFWWPTRHRDGPDSRCWRPSASSPKNSLYRPARPMTRAARTPDTSQAAKLMSWPCGTARANGKPTNGSPSSWRTCAVHFGGPPTTTTSTRQSRSPISQRSSVFGSNSMNPSGGPKSSSIRARAVDHRRLSQLYVMAAMCYATGRVDDSLGYATAGRQAIESGRFDEVPYEFEVGFSASVRHCRSSPTSGLIGAAASSHEDQALTPLPRHSW